MATIGRESDEEARSEAVRIVSNHLIKLRHVDSDGLMSLAEYMDDNVEVDLMMTRALIEKITVELEKTKYAMVHANNCTKKLESVSRELIDTKTREIILGNAVTSRQMMKFLALYRNMHEAVTLIKKLEMFNKYLNKIEVDLSENDGQCLNYALIYKMLNISHEIKCRVMEQAMVKSQDIRLTEKTLEVFFSRLIVLTSEFELRYCNMSRNVLDLMLQGNYETVLRLLEVLDNIKPKSEERKQQLLSLNMNKGLTFKVDLGDAFMDKLRQSIINYVNNLRHKYRPESYFIIMKKGYETISQLLEDIDTHDRENTSMRDIILVSTMMMHEKLHEITNSAYMNEELTCKKVLEYDEIINRYKMLINIVYAQNIVSRNNLIEQISMHQKTLFDEYTKNEFNLVFETYNSLVKGRIIDSNGNITNENIGKLIKENIFCKLEETLNSKFPLLVHSGISTFFELLRTILSNYEQARKVIVSITLKDNSDPENIEVSFIKLLNETDKIALYIKQKLIPILNYSIIETFKHQEDISITEFKDNINNIMGDFFKMSKNCLDYACNSLSKRINVVNEPLFTIKWYEGEVFSFAVSTALDFLSHLNDSLSVSLKHTIIDRVFNVIVNSYFQALKTKKVLLKINSENIIKKDAKYVEVALENIGVTDWESYTVPIHAFADIVSSTKPTTITAACKKFYESYPCCTFALISRILRGSYNCKDDIVDGILETLESNIENSA